MSTLTHLMRVCVCVCVFILTAYDRSQFSIDEVSCKQGKGLPCCEFALMTTPSFPLAIRQAGTPAGMRSSTKDSAINVVQAEHRFIRTLSLSRFWLNIRFNIKEECIMAGMVKSI